MYRMLSLISKEKGKQEGKQAHHDARIGKGKELKTNLKNRFPTEEGADTGEEPGLEVRLV